MGQQLGPAGLTRALEAIGEALLEMRQAPDARIPLEVALVRLTRPESDISPSALLARIEALEAGGVPAAAPPAGCCRSGAPPAADRPTPTGAHRAADAVGRPRRRRRAGPHRCRRPPPRRRAPPPRPERPAAAEVRWTGRSGAGEAGREGPPHPPARSRRSATSARASDAGIDPPRRHARRTRPSAAEPTPAEAQRSATEPRPDRVRPDHRRGCAAPGTMPSRDDLTLAWADHVLSALRPAVKARFAAGRFMTVDDTEAVFGLPNQAHRDKCDERRADVEAALADHFGQPVPLRLVVDDGSGGAEPAPSSPTPGPKRRPTPSWSRTKPPASIPPNWSTPHPRPAAVASTN